MTSASHTGHTWKSLVCTTLSQKMKWHPQSARLPLLSDQMYSHSTENEGFIPRPHSAILHKKYKKESWASGRTIENAWECYVLCSKLETKPRWLSLQTVLSSSLLQAIIRLMVVRDTTSDWQSRGVWIISLAGLLLAVLVMGFMADVRQRVTSTSHGDLCWLWSCYLHLSKILFPKSQLSSFPGFENEQLNAQTIMLSLALKVILVEWLEGWR